MKKILFLTLMLFGTLTMALAQKPAEIKFDKTTHDFGKFSEKTPVVSCVFTFTNVGEQPLIINQVFPSCGCTVAEHTKTPVKQGETGEIKVTYNGARNGYKHFRKSITVRTNGVGEMVRLNIEGEMVKAE